MPTFRDITVTIHTPFAIEGVPEIAPIPIVHLPTGIPKKLLDDTNKIVSVYIPVPPQSLFWLSYSATPPTDDIFYVFKLFINHAHIVTWSCDKEEEWKGKVQFGLFDSGKKHVKMVGGGGMQKSVFQFGDHDWGVAGDLNGEGMDARCVEVKVYRANKKVRIPRRIEYAGSLVNGEGVNLQNAGLTKRGHPRKYYNFGLLDPKEDPHAIFKFFYRSSFEVEELNVRVGQVERTDAEAVSAQRIASEMALIENGSPVQLRKVSRPDMPKTYKPTRDSVATTSDHYVPPVPPMPKTTPAAIPRMPGQINLRRLSIPPSTLFRPLMEHGPLPASPTKTPINSPTKRDESRVKNRNRDSASGVFRSIMQGSLNRRPSVNE